MGGVIKVQRRGWDYALATHVYRTREGVMGYIFDREIIVHPVKAGRPLHAWAGGETERFEREDLDEAKRWVEEQVGKL